MTTSQQELIFSQFWGLEVQDQDAGMFAFAWASLLGLQMAAYLGCPHMAFPLPAGNSGASSSSCKDSDHLGSGPHSDDLTEPSSLPSRPHLSAGAF